MNRNMFRIAAPAVVAVVALMLFGGAAQAADPKKNRDGRDGKAGTSTVTCRSVQSSNDGVIQCTARGGAPGAGYYWLWSMRLTR